MFLPLAALAAWHSGAIICLFLVFSLAGVSKLRVETPFIRSVEAFSRLPLPYAVFVARWLPRFEVVLSLLLLVPLLTRWVAGVISVLLVFFLLGSLRNYKSNAVDCGCFGGFITETSGITSLGRDLLLLFISVSLILIHAPLIVSDQWLLLVTVPSLLVLVTLYIEVIRSLQLI